MWAYKIWLIKFLIICSINANIVSSPRFQLKLQLIELRIYKSLYKTCIYMYIHIFLIVCYIKNLKFSQFWSSLTWNISETPRFLFYSWVWRHIKNTFSNLVLFIIQGKGHYGQLLSSTQVFLQTLTTNIFFRR